MKTSLKRVGLLGLSLLLGACSSSTPTSRIEANPHIYKSLPTQQQTLVERGEICQGMNQQAVFLAWGYPNTAPFKGEKNKIKTERWVYTSLRPVMTSTSWAGPAWGAYYPYDPFFYETTSYIPENRADVTFENGKVVRWEKRN